MEVKVKLNNVRISPRKSRQVIDLIRGKKAQEAQSILSFTTNKPARPILKLLNSAIASAVNNFHLDESSLFISTILVDEGLKLKRWHPMSRGRAYPIIKRSSHITLVLSDGKKPIAEQKTEEKKIEKTEKKTKKITKKSKVK